MSILPAHRQGLVPDLNTLWHVLAHAGLGSSTGTHLLAVEDSIENGRYVVRAEIPGVDPDKDVEVSVQGRQLTIKAERSELHQGKGRSEFTYGSFYRSVSLPQGADTDSVEASYSQGILTVSVPVAEPEAAAKKIEVKTED